MTTTTNETQDRREPTTTGAPPRLRAVFFGSPDFAVPSLEATARACELVAVVTQPDKPAGRGKAPTPPAVKVEAERLGVPLIQPTKMRDGSLLEALRPLDLDVAVVVAFGRILPKELLELPRLGCLNVHASLLPRWRGAAPIQRAVLAGDHETGVCIMQMDEGLDTGPVHRRVVTPIAPLETSGQLFDRLSQLGADALESFLRALPDVPPPTPQPGEGMTHAAKLEKHEGATDFTRPAKSVVDHVRGMDPWPSATARLRDDVLKLFAAERSDREAHGAAPGAILAIDDRGLHVACGEGAIAIRDVQAPGKKRMPAKAFAAGLRPSPVGERLTPS
jgi:methionyl-tRNA formyltransferase